jgi:hypothetical protein
MTDTELRDLQADLGALKRAAGFFFSLIATAAVAGSIAYWSWYATIPAVAVAYVCDRRLYDILWPERVAQRAIDRSGRRARWAAWNDRHPVLSASWTLLLALVIGVGVLIGGSIMFR